uniref:NAD-dependent epimerase/dehydratase domain-containing protein n=1 Tax=uncultured prokaryote TaxID=198431 RepID=A0A0H5Q7S3_9ZZZZ|nr:hypothetical protein [uncultured prokaryote]
MPICRFPCHEYKSILNQQIMTKIGTTFTKSGKKAVLCGSGELGKEVAIELQRYGVEVVALDKYANAPAMHIAHRSHVLPMLDGDALEAVIREEKPDYVIPEIEAIATDNTEGRRNLRCWSTLPTKALSSITTRMSRPLRMPNLSCTVTDMSS